MENNLPISIKLLFDNKYLKYVDVLLVLYMNKRKQKGVVYEEVLYCFTLLNLLSAEEPYQLDKTYLQNNYLNYDQKLKQDIRVLINQNLIEIKVEKVSKKNLMYFKILDLGIKLIDSMKTQYFENRINKITYLKKNMPYNSNNEKGVLNQ